MKRSRIKKIILMLIIASLLAIGCSAETPKPGKPNTEINKEPSESVPPAVVPTPTPAPDNKPGIPEVEETVKPETGESVKPAPEETKKPDMEESQKPGTEEKEEPVIVIPEWARNKSYRNHKGILDFNENGIPSLPVAGDISISEATEEKMVITVDSETFTITRNEDSSITLGDTILYLDIDGPDWLKGKAYQGRIVLAFDDRGLLEYINTGHKLSHIGNITDDSVDIVLVDEDGNSVEITIVKHDHSMETIKLIVGSQEEILAKAEKIPE